MARISVITKGRWASAQRRIFIPVFRKRITIVVLAALFLTSNALAQSALFGSIDDPTERVSVSKWRHRSTVEFGGGFSLVGPQWYTAAVGDFTSTTPKTFLHLSSLVRTGLYGAYKPDTDEAYDVLRMVETAKYQSSGNRVYARIGPLDRTRLGSGHLVSFFSTDAARDNRTVGLETRLSNPVFTFDFFAERLSAHALVGSRLTVKPFGETSGTSTVLSTLEIGTSVVRDRRTPLRDKGPFDASEADIRVQVYRTGGFQFFPYVSFARIADYGQGLSFGADVENDNFADVARLHFRLALHYNSSDFQSGYYGAFYTVNSHRAEIQDESGVGSAGFALREIERGNSIETEFRLLIFERFELWYAFMRYHGVQELSEYHLRLWLRTNRFVVSIGQDRRGLVGFRSLFNSLGDENRMSFNFDYRVFQAIWIKINANYTYVKLPESRNSLPQFIVQRRFNPMIVLRYPTTSR